jgi:4-amino-4-deoxychorismate lyase
MLQLIESICYENGVFQRVPLHEERMNRARYRLFGKLERLSLSHLRIPEELNNQKIKCRITYSAAIDNIEFESYIPKPITSLKLVADDCLDYPYKYKNRDALYRLFDLRGPADEILIVKNGKLTDTSFSNIVLLKDGNWFTPDSPLLPGTRRADYLQKQLIIEQSIKPEDLHQYEEARLINAMRSLEEAEPIKISAIF